ncbi:hypothetical protein [Brachyspira sp.]|uniref:hypothetical protein n=1 Tax=Brachyspira sp. TaxID=1977261 RepID=UPI003D7C62DB
MVKLGVTNLRDYIYTGKVETNGIVYPYTNDITSYYYFRYDNMQVKDELYGKFIFNSQSSCTVKYDKIGADNEPFINEKGEDIAASMGTISTEIVEFTKQ